MSATLLLAVPTSALSAEAPLGVRINEVVSNSGSPDDWIEFYNHSDADVDLSGYIVQDNSEKNPYTFPEGTIVTPGEYLVIDTLSDSGEGDFDFGLGKGDSVRVFAPGDANGAEPLLQTTWPEGTHAVPSWGAQDVNGELVWGITAASTKGAENTFEVVPEEPEEPEEPVAGSVFINEVDSQPADWVEFYNPGETAFDVSGYEIRDNSDDHRWQFAPGTSIPAGGFLVVEEGTIGIVDGVETAFRDPIGIGSADRIRLFDTSGALVDDTQPWEGHAAIDGDFAAATLARCIDGEGAFALATPTPGAPNACALPAVVINEIESNGDATDWVEVYNAGTAAVDISGWTVMDDKPAGHEAETTPLPAGTLLAAGGYFVFDQPTNFVFGLGGGDTVTVRDANGRTVDEHVYADHAKGVWARCGGEFVDVAVSTKGAVNDCEGGGDGGGGEIDLATWPGSADVRVLDTAPMFLEDGSGLDIQETADGTFLWAVDNGEGRIWKLKAAADGSVSMVDGWAEGKRVRFQKDAENPGAAGPDTEGITTDADGLVYVASERDNSAKGVNENKILQVDPNGAGPDLVALTEWDLTALLPAVGANLGIEAVEWVPDAALTGKLFDDEAQAAYDPAEYAGKKAGLFFVAVEDNGGVYAFALSADGSAQLVSTIDPGLAGVMALDYDSVLGVMWAVCDDGCHGASAQITLNGTAEPGIAHFARAAGLPDINNEGFATAPASLASNGQRPVWWFADGFASEALRTGTLPAAGGGGEGPGEGPGQGGSQPGPSIQPLPGDEIVEGNRGGATVDKSSVAPGDQVTITLGAQHAGVDVEVWMYSDPMFLTDGTLNAAGAITVTIPKDAAAGAHRLAVYSASGELLGWVNIQVTAAGGGLAATGSELPGGALVLALGLLFAGAIAVTLRRRRQTA
ncbi:lamin tail domain-containing protein [Microbacterium sp.]|uniref:lamin tail domain-containing protein n=1 Tax=Microbacterium sp. TaxID=51671 RepID=UPI0027371B43|nr:lamin tail domain-containing protein [Microbacterium sp.]